LTTPADDSGDEPEGYAPGASNTDTEAVYGSPVAPSPGSPGSTSGNLEQNASNTDTTGTSVAGIGAAIPGGSTTDTIPWSGSGQLGGQTGPGPLQGNSGYTVTGTNPSSYGWPLGSPDTEGAYGGTKPTAPITPASPYAWVPASTALTGTLDTIVGLGSDLVPSEFPSPNAYRAPGSAVAASVKDTTLTDVMGSQLTASPLTDASYAALNVDTSYIGAPAAPASLSAQVDTYASTAAATPYYATQQGIVPSTLVVTDSTSAQTLVLNTDYTLTTALNGPSTACYITLTHVTKWTAGDTVTLAYSYGTPQYYDSNLPPAVSQTVADTLYLSQAPARLHAWGVTTAAASITVFDVTQNASLTYNTDYTVTKIVAPYTPGSSYSETPLVTYAINWKPTSSAAKLGDTITATYAYTTSIPLAPAMGASASQTDSISSISTSGTALSQTGIVTPPAAMTVLNVTTARAMVMNTDYTVAITGTGSTLTYSVARLSGSTASANGDHWTVTYSYGNAAYFTSGPVIAQNLGVTVPWGAPSGVTAVDYYLVQCTDLGTQYVPASGMPVDYGQPSPGGSSPFGEPTYQVDTFSGFPGSALAAPGTPVTSTATSGGTVANGTYKVETTYVTAVGETVASVSTTQVTTGTNISTLTVNSPAAATGATGWYAYWTQAGGSTYTRQQAAGSPTAIGTNLTLTAPPTSTGANPPAANSTLPQTSRQGVVTPAGQLIVRDLTSVQQDPLQADASVLIYNYDYTVAQSGAGPWTTYSVSRLSSSVNSAATDTITVSYWWNTQGAVPLTAVEDAVIASSSVASLLHADIAIPLSSLIVYDTTISKPLAYGLDFTAVLAGEGPVATVKITLITTGPAGAGASDHLNVYYLYGQALSVLFTQGIFPNSAPIYTPAGAQRTQKLYQFAVAAGNRAGLGPFSVWSDYASPLNYNAPQPGAQGSPNVGTGSYDPANTVNGIYTPAGTIKPGTGLGM
jgi:hypothetical protein